MDERSDQLKSGSYSEPKYPKYIAHRIGVFQRERNPVFNNAKRADRGCLQNEIRKLGNQIQQIIQVGYDRARNTINRVITSVRDRIEAARDSFFRASKRLAGNGQQLATAAKQFDTSTRTIEQTAAQGDESIQRNQRTFSQGMATVRGNRTDELQRLKAGINLSEYAAEQGYVLIKNESSRNSFVMQLQLEHQKNTQLEKQRDELRKELQAANALTTMKPLKKNDKGEDLHAAKDTADLFDKTTQLL